MHFFPGRGASPRGEALSRPARLADVAGVVGWGRKRAIMTQGSAGACPFVRYGQPIRNPKELHLSLEALEQRSRVKSMPSQ